MAVLLKRLLNVTTLVLLSRTLLELGITPRQIFTKESFENAITYVIATGGSTNAVLHLVAIAHSAGVRSLDNFKGRHSVYVS